MDQNNRVGLEAAKALVREYFQRLLNEKDLSVCDEMLSSDYIDHDAPPDTLPGPKSTKEFVTGFLEEYPDMRVDIEDIIYYGLHHPSKRGALEQIWGQLGLAPELPEAPKLELH